MRTPANHFHHLFEPGVVLEHEVEVEEIVGCEGRTCSGLVELGRTTPHLEANTRGHQQVDDPLAGVFGHCTCTFGTLEAVRALVVVGAHPHDELSSFELHITTGWAVRSDGRHCGPPSPDGIPSAALAVALTPFLRHRPETPGGGGPVCGLARKQQRISGIRPITFAHRGARLEARENSLAAFGIALGAGVAGLESDARLSEDGQPVLAHDASVRRGLRRVTVGSTPAAALADLDVPTLAALYATCGIDFELSLDLKTPDVGEAVIAEARRVGAADRLWLCSPDLRVLENLRDSDPDIRLVHSTRKRELLAPIERHAAQLHEHGIRAMNMHHTDWTAGIVSLFHRFSIAAFAWDAQEVRTLRALLRIGVDALYCDRPERMMAVVGEYTDEQAQKKPKRPSGQ